jgi:hypothetical protein
MAKTPEPVQPKQSPLKFILLLALAAVVAGAAGYLYMPKQSAPSTKTTEKSQRAPEGWKKYADAEFKVEFYYPSELGEISTTTKSGPIYSGRNGKVLGFSGSEGLKFGIAEESASRRQWPVPYDFRGYQEQDGKYFFTNWQGERREFKPVKKVGDALVIDVQSFILKEGDTPPLYTPGNEEQVGLLNLPKGAKYPAIVFWNGADHGKAAITAEQLEQLLKSIKVIK